MSNVNKVLEAFAYYIGNGGYYEKASAKNLSREISDFAANKGSANYTYMGKLCGINPGAWCAMMVSTAVYEACGNDREAAKTAMWGVWPYAACNQLFDAAPAGKKHYSWYGLNKKGKTGEAYTPKAGDVIVFTDAWKSRDHTGMVYAVDDTTVYTYEGNSGNMARKRSYPLTSAYIYGYVELNLEEEQLTPIQSFQRWLGVTADGIYGPVTKAASIKAHQKAVNTLYGVSIDEDGEWGPETYYATRNVQQGDEGDEVKVWQGVLYCLGQDPQGLDGEFGKNTLAATVALQEALGLSPGGIADRYTWAKAFGCGRPDHTELKHGSKGAEVAYLQERLWHHGFLLDQDGVFGAGTLDDVKDFQRQKGLEPTGVVDAAMWELLE